MALSIKKSIVLGLVAIFTMTLRVATEDGRGKKAFNEDKSNIGRDDAPIEPSYRGKALSHWINLLRGRDEDMMPLALEAIQRLGPDASAAVPELTRVVGAPFTPIRLGKDSDEVIAEKLYDLAIRSTAIDCLALIGEAASPATIPVVQWALTVRVIPATMSSMDEDERFVDLVTLDAEYRIGMIRAVKAFGEPAIPMLARLLKSSDVETRKLAIMILGGDALPIAADLLNSRSCEDAALGITILSDMEPLVPKAYLTALRRMLECNAN